MRDRPESGMLLAELVVWHTRPLAPTRRLALGNLVLPTDPPPGLGGLLLGAVVAEHARDVDDDLIPDLHRLIEQVERGDRVVQPRLRHRFQVDRHGLGHSTHRLYAEGDDLRFAFDPHGSPLAMVTSRTPSVTTSASPDSPITTFLARAQAATASFVGGSPVSAENSA